MADSSYAPGGAAQPFDSRKSISAVEVAMSSNRLDEAEALCNRVLSKEPSSLPAHFYLAIVAIRHGDWKLSAERLRFVVRSDPNALQALEMLVDILRQHREYEEAQELSGRLVQLWPTLPGGYMAMGLCLMEQGKGLEAKLFLEKAVDLDPDLALHHFNLGRALEAVSLGDDATKAYRQSIRLAPGVAHQHEALGKLLVRNGQSEEGVENLVRSYDLKPSPTVALHIALAFVASERFEEAEPYFQKAVQLEPTFHRAYEFWAENLQVLGWFDQAALALRRAIEVAPARPGPYLSLFGIRKVSDDDHALVMQVEQMANDSSRSKDDLRILNYALAKAHADLGRDEDAMKRYDTANRLAFETLMKGQSFERRNHPMWIDSQIATFTPGYFIKNRHLAFETDSPVFIIGMIRSGTTLTEQVLSCHPQIACAGEVEYWTDKTRTDLMRKLLAGKIAPFELVPTAVKYVELLDKIANSLPRVTDKMPFNYLALGLIHLFFPNARIIHCRRNPIDTCLSIYMTPFAKGAEFCYDRKSIVLAYKEYLRVMAHWRRILPSDKLIEIDYEEMVLNLEPVARKMVSFCGLPWDDACLRANQNKRAVQTPSRWQVRQPIYATSVERWRRFEPWLGEFEALK